MDIDKLTITIIKSYSLSSVLLQSCDTYQHENV